LLVQDLEEQQMQQPTHPADLQRLAHLQQEALTAVQALERHRLDPHQAALTQAALEAHLQQQLREKK
jgi:hypothetical protein